MTLGPAAGLSGEDDAKQDQGGADAAGQCHPLAQEDHRRDQGEDRIEIHVIGRGDVPQFGHDEVPGDEAGQGGHEAQEEEVGPDGERAQELQREAAVGTEEERDDGQEPVEEDFPGLVKNMLLMIF